MVQKIKFGTDGWRAIIAKEYTVENVTRVAEGTAKWVKQRNGSKVVIGHDCRFGGKLFAETTARVLGAYGIKSYLAPDFVSTPMVSLGIVKTGSDMGVVITASHNPPSYNGYKLKSKLGGPMIEKEVLEVEALIPDKAMQELPTIAELEEKGLVEYRDFEQIYIDHVESNFDMELIKNAGFGIAFDPMYGAGQRAMKRLFPNAVFIHNDYNPSFKGQAPEPILRNLKPFAELIKKDGSIKVGIATDGDADRIGMFDEDGQFVDSHHILLMLLIYKFKYQKERGKVVVSFSVTNKLEQLAREYGLDYKVTKIGFKYIAEIMANEHVIVGGEESGGLAVSGHIPERDGIWIGMVILEYMARTGKTLKELVDEVHDAVGTFTFDRDDLHLTEAIKQRVIADCKAGTYKSFGDYKVTRVDTIDGFRFYMGEDRWVMIRPSGTEPVLRIYAQAPTIEETRTVLDVVERAIGVVD